jgi:hypothetical protein
MDGTDRAVFGAHVRIMVRLGNYGRDLDLGLYAVGVMSAKISRWQLWYFSP